MNLKINQHQNTKMSKVIFSHKKWNYNKRSYNKHVKINLFFLIYNNNHEINMKKSYFLSIITFK